MATLGTGQQSRRGGVAAVRASRPPVHTRRCGLPVKGDGFLESLRMDKLGGFLHVRCRYNCGPGNETEFLHPLLALRRLCGGKETTVSEISGRGA